MTRDMTTLVDVAREYGVDLLPYPELDTPEHADMCRGPAGHGLDVDARCVYVDWVEFSDTPRQLALILHELMHVVCQPPHTPINSVCEGWLLLAVERKVARTRFSRAAFLAVADFQNDTHVEDTILEAWDNYTHSAWWREAVARARRLDLFDDRNLPTRRPPDWSRL